MSACNREGGTPRARVDARPREAGESPEDPFPAPGRGRKERGVLASSSRGRLRRRGLFADREEGPSMNGDLGLAREDLHRREKPAPAAASFGNDPRSLSPSSSPRSERCDRPRAPGRLPKGETNEPGPARPSRARRSDPHHSARRKSFRKKRFSRISNLFESLGLDGDRAGVFRWSFGVRGVVTRRSVGPNREGVFDSGGSRPAPEARERRAASIAAAAARSAGPSRRSAGGPIFRRGLGGAPGIPSDRRSYRDRRSRHRRRPARCRGAWRCR